MLILLLSCIVLLLSKAKVNQELLAIGFIIIIAIISAFRSFLIPDTHDYANFFQTLSNSLSLSLNSTYMESGFVIFSYMIKILFGNNYKIFFFIITVFNFFFIYKGVKNIQRNKDYSKKNKVIIPLVVYSIVCGFEFNFIVLRVGMAFSLVFYAFSLYPKKKIWALLVYTLSIFFHNSALIVVLSFPFFLSKKKLKFITVFSICSLSLFLSVFVFMGLLSDLFLSVLEKSLMASDRFFEYFKLNLFIYNPNIFIGYLVRIAIIFVLLKGQEEKIKQVVLKNYMLSIFIMALFINTIIVGRVIFFFDKMIFILITEYFVNYKKNQIQKLILFFFLLYSIISVSRVLLFHQSMLKQ